jgi:hypothetical protein
MSDGEEVKRISFASNVWISDPFAYNVDGDLLAIQVFHPRRRSESEHVIYLVDLETEERLATLKYGSFAYDLEFSKDGRFLIGAIGDGTIRIWGVDPR